MGYITKRGSRYYVVMYMPNRDGIKKQKWFSGFTTRNSASEFMARKTLDISKQEQFGVETLETHLNTWFSFQQTRLRPGTIRSYRWLISHYLIPQFGSCPLNGISPENIQSFYLKLIDEGLSKQTVLNLHRVLKNALNRALLWGKIGRNVAALVQPPRVQTPIFDVWTPEQVKQFLTVSKRSKYHLVFLIAVSTGMRLGEILALTWNDCDLENGVIRVRRTMAYTGHGYQIEPPKTKRGVRAVSLPGVVLETLKAQKQSESNPLPDNLVIRTDGGHPVLQHNLRMLFYSLIKHAKLPKIRIHDLRHTHASLLLQAGIHPKIVQERLGHASIETTLNIYAHVLPHVQESAASAFNNILK